MKYRDLNPQMSWPPKEDDLKSIRTIDYIPHLLVFSGKSLESESCFKERTITEKESFAQDIAFFSVTKGAVVKTPKSVLFLSVVKALCNNTEIEAYQYGHGIIYDPASRRDRDRVCDRALPTNNERSELSYWPV